MTLDQIAGWIPAIVFPGASLIQLAVILWMRDARGVSVTTWSLFAVANLSLYLYIGRYAEPQAILTGLGTAAANIGVVVAAVRFRGRGSGANAGAATAR